MENQTFTFPTAFIESHLFYWFVKNIQPKQAERGGSEEFVCTGLGKAAPSLAQTSRLLLEVKKTVLSFSLVLRGQTEKLSICSSWSRGTRRQGQGAQHGTWLPGLGERDRQGRRVQMHQTQELPELLLVCCCCWFYTSSWLKLI